MGASISICNLTAVIINVSLKHVSPLYYANQLQPKQCTNFDTGRVWFTVEARIWTNGNNEYNEAQKLLIPTGLGLIVPPLAAGLGGVIHGLVNKPTAPLTNETSWMNGTSTNDTQTASGRIDLTGAKIVAGSSLAAVPGGVIVTAGSIVSMDNTPKSWWVAKHGVYMTPGRKINIKGGPKNVTFYTRNCPSTRCQRIKDTEFDALQIDIEK